MESDGSAATRPAPRQRLNRQERRAQILAAAREIFVEEGVHGARSRLIADRAGITEAYLYRHFPSKDELFQLAIDEPLRTMITDLQNDTREMASRTDVPRRQILARCHQLFLDCMVDLAPLVGTALFSDPESGRQLYRDVIQPQIQAVIELILPDISGWPAGSVDAELFAVAMLGVNLNIALEALVENRTFDSSAVSAQIAEMFGSGTSRRSNRATKRPPTKDSARSAQVDWWKPPVEEPATNGSNRRMPAAQRQEKMVQAARAVFERNGLSGGRTREIAERAGVTEAFLYRYFESKDELYRVAVLDYLAQAIGTLRDEINGVFEAEQDPRRFLDEVSALCLAYYERYGLLQASATFGDATYGPAFYRHALAPVLDAIVQMIAERLGWDAGESDLVVVRGAVLGAMWMVGVDAAVRESALSPYQLARRLNVLFTGGVRP